MLWVETKRNRTRLLTSHTCFPEKNTFFTAPRDGGWPITNYITTLIMRMVYVWWRLCFC